MAAFCLKVPGSQFYVLLKDVLMAEMIFICEKNHSQLCFLKQ